MNIYCCVIISLFLFFQACQPAVNKPLTVHPPQKEVRIPSPTQRASEPHTQQPLRFRQINELDQEPMAELQEGGLVELSGMVPAGRPLEYWGVNDKGNSPVLYRFVRDGRLRQKVLLRARDAQGNWVLNTDWEAMTADAEGNLYIGGIGDNDQERAVYFVYRLSEPGFHQKETGLKAIYPYRYSDGASHNSEAMLIFQESIYLITKVEDEDEPAKVFRLSEPAHNGQNTAEYLGETQITETVTGAAYNPSRNLLAVLSYERLYFYELRSEADLLGPPAQSIEIDFDQSEALCIDGDHLILTNEDGEIWWYNLGVFIQ